MGVIARLRQRLTGHDTPATPQPHLRDPISADRESVVNRSPARTTPVSTPRNPSPSQAHTHPRFAVVDVETTGLSATSHRILEIAVVTTDPGGRVIDTWTTRLNPQGPVGATHIHGITDRDVADAPLFADIVEDLNARLVGAALAAHNARFDLAFLRAEYARVGWRMPFVPALCTLEASTHHLPNLPRRRLVDVCDALGLPRHRAHSAVHDATATAALLAGFLHPGRPPRQCDLDLPGQGHAIVWPPAGEGRPLPIPSGRDAHNPSARQLSAQARRNLAATAATPAAKPLVQLISRFSLVDALDEGAPTGAVAYLEKLAEVLEDGVLDPAEAAALADVADTYDLADADTAAAHLAFTRALAREAMADGKLTRAERAELAGVALALDVPAAVISGVLADATAHHHAKHGADLSPLPEDWAFGEPLRVGDRIVFTGCDPDHRSALEQASAAAGVRVMSGVAKTTAMLVTDGSMDGGKARKAAELGTRTVSPETYRLLLDHIQPTAPTPAKASAVAKRVIRSAEPAASMTDTPAAGTVATSTGTVAGAGVGPSPATLRAWGRANGWVLGDRGRLPKELRDAYLAAHPDA
jgi:DNA polymerase-3 subunit epsilon